MQLTQSLKVKEMEEAEKRKREKEEHKKKLQEEAALPPRMLQDAESRPNKEKKIEDLRKKLYEQHHTLKPKVNKEVPKFDELQKAFETNLENKKKAQEPTKPAPFSFDKNKKDQQDGSNQEEEVDPEVQKEREEKKRKQEEEGRAQKGLKADAINTFLTRNFAPTEEKQIEAQKGLLKKNEKKIENLMKNNENRAANKTDLIRETVLPKNISKIVMGEAKRDDILKPKYLIKPEDNTAEDKAAADPTAGGLFSLEQVDEGDQFMPGMPRASKPKKEPKKPEKLFSAVKPKTEAKVIDSTTVKTKAQIEAEEMRKKQQEEKKKETDAQKAELEARQKKEKEAAIRVREKLGQNPFLHNENDQKIKEYQEGVKAATKNYEKDRKEMSNRVGKKACLVEESRTELT